MKESLQKKLDQEAADRNKANKKQILAENKAAEIAKEVMDKMLAVEDKKIKAENEAKAKIEADKKKKEQEEQARKDAEEAK